MFQRKKLNIEKDRHVVLAIKSTGFKPNDGHCMTQVACVEMLNGKATGNEYNSYLKVDDEKLFEGCKKLYNEALGGKGARALIANMEKAPSFKNEQKNLMAFLTKTPDTKIIVHVIGYVLNFMRNELSEANLEKFSGLKMENIISKSAKLNHAGNYDGGKYPSQIDKGIPMKSTGRAFYTFDDILSELYVLPDRNGFSALDNARKLALAETNRLAEFGKAAKAGKQVESNNHLKM